PSALAPFSLHDALPISARRGFITLALDGLRQDQPALGLSTAGLLVWNHLRAIEYLLARPNLDRSRIALVSAGAGSYLAASVIALDRKSTRLNSSHGSNS